jgi:hypothetical protein
MKIKMDFDANDFNRKLERAAKTTANEALNNIGRGLQHACDQVYAAREGKTAEQLYEELSANVSDRNLAVTIPDANLHAYAEAMAEGRRVTVKVEGI